MSQFALVSFAMTAGYSNEDDNVVSFSANVGAFPSSTSAGTPVLILWNTSNIAQVEITANNGTDPPIDSGLITTYGAGFLPLPLGFTKTTIVTMDAYDSMGNLVASPTTQVTISPNYFGDAFGTGFVS